MSRRCILPLSAAVLLLMLGRAPLRAQTASPDGSGTRPFGEGMDLHEPPSTERGVVEAEDLPPYSPPAETSVTGLPAPVQELPVTVNTLTERFLKDTSAHRIQDAVGYLPGVSATETNGNVGDSLTIRGFENDDTFINGVRNRVSQITRQFANIDRVEILKGPAGVEFGVGEPGGFVNYVTKKPLDHFALSFGSERGSYDYYGGYFDATGPLWTPAKAAPALAGKDGKATVAPDDAPGNLGVFYRFIGAGNSADSFRDTLNTDRILIAPSLLWNYAAGSSLLLELEYQHSNQPYDRGTIFLQGAGFEDNFAPNNLSYHEPADFEDENEGRVSLYWVQQLGTHLSLRLTGEANGDYQISSGARNPDPTSVYIPGTNEWNGTRDVQRSFTLFKGWNYSFVGKPELLANFDTGPVKHEALLGFDYQYSPQHSKGHDGQDTWPIDFQHPVYGTHPTPLPPADPTDPTSLPDGARDFRDHSHLEEYGVYYQHKADFFNRVHLLGGVRYDWYENKDAYVDNIRLQKFPPETGIGDQNLSWRVGGVADLYKGAFADVSAFAGYSRSFEPQSGLLTGGGFPQALEASSFEFGLKGGIFQDRLTATLSFFQISRKNILEADPLDPTGQFSIPIGTVRVRGLEYEVTGRITRDLDVQGGFSLLASEFTETPDPATLGHEFYNVPRVQGGLRLHYDTSRWLLSGFSVGAGVIYMGDRNGDDANTFILPSYWRFDAGWYYQWRNLNFKLTCDNLLDRRFQLASQDRNFNIQPGEPRLLNFATEVHF